MTPAILIWLIIALLFLIFEMGHPGLFYFLSFFIGALGAALTSVWFDSMIVQLAVFLGVSFGALFILRVFVARWVRPADSGRLSNFYALEGKQGVVVAAIGSGCSGLVKVGGEVWSARAVNEQSIEIHAPVIIVSVVGAHLLVKEINS